LRAVEALGRTTAVRALAVLNGLERIGPYVVAGNVPDEPRHSEWPTTLQIRAAYSNAKATTAAISIVVNSVDGSLGCTGFC
jgi:hypothetical protein